MFEKTSKTKSKFKVDSLYKKNSKNKFKQKELTIMKKLKNENSKFIKDLTNVDVAIKFYQYRLTFYNQLEKNDTKHDRNFCLDQLDKASSSNEYQT